MNEIHQEYQSSFSELETYAKRAIKYAAELGATQAEVRIINGFRRSLDIKNNSINGMQQQANSYILARVFVGKQQGKAEGTMLTANSIDDIVKSAVNLSKFSPADEKFKSLASPLDREVHSVKNLFDQNIANLDPEIMVEFGKEIVSGAQEVHELVNTNAGITLNVNDDLIHNSEGIFVTKQSSSLSAYSYVTIPLEPTNVGLGSEFNNTRHDAKSMNCHQIGMEGANKAKSSLNAKTISSGTLPVLFDFRGAYNSLQSLIDVGVSAYNVMLKTSYFSDKLGESISVNNLTAWDDPLVDGGSSSRMYDSEGIPTQKINIVENGILKAFVTDSYTSAVMDIDNTGSANFYSGIKSYRPNICQLQVNHGDISKDEMLSDMKEGLFVESGVSTSGGGSPNISSKVNRGFYVKDGEIQYPVKNTMLGSNVYEFLKNIVGISKELKFEFGHQTPSILVNELSIASAGDSKAPVQSMGP
ncbi:MAG: TldD/PmbA family protein [Candidatus Heimdallarchaeota archaeon]|nr:TldD/PmbA family protein [Candidatus Heimdallarchaeota archaeon]